MKFKRFFSAIKAQNNDLEILLYDSIGYDFWSGGGVTAKDLAAQLKEAGAVNNITLKINSPGGDVFEGAAMYNILAQHDAPVSVIVEGLAASAASYVAMVGNKIRMGQGAMLMIHNPWSFTMGDAAEMRKTADTLDKVRESMMGAYMKRYKGSEADMKAVMDAETWMTAQDAVDCGMADCIMPEKAKSANALAQAFDLSKFKNLPESLKQVPVDDDEEEEESPLPAALIAAHRARELDLIRLS